MENPITMDDDWRYPYFRKPPYNNNVNDMSTTIVTVTNNYNYDHYQEQQLAMTNNN